MFDEPLNKQIKKMKNALMSIGLAVAFSLTAYAQHVFTPPHGTLQLQMGIAPYDESTDTIGSYTTDVLNAPNIAVKLMGVRGSWCVLLLRTHLALPPEAGNTEIAIYNDLTTRYPWLVKPSLTDPKQFFDQTLRDSNMNLLVSQESLSQSVSWPSDVVIDAWFVSGLIHHFAASVDNVRGWGEPILVGTAPGNSVGPMGWTAYNEHWNAFPAVGEGSLNDIWYSMFRSQLPTGEHIMRAAVMADTGAKIQAAGYSSPSTYEEFIEENPTTGLSDRHIAAHFEMYHCTIQAFAVRAPFSVTMIGNNPWEILPLLPLPCEFTITAPLVFRIDYLTPEGGGTDLGNAHGQDDATLDFDPPIAGHHGQTITISLSNAFGSVHVGFPNDQGSYSVVRATHAGPGRISVVVPEDAISGYLAYANPVEVVIGGPTVFGTTFILEDPPQPVGP